jgi:hypothetical protein
VRGNLDICRFERWVGKHFALMSVVIAASSGFPNLLQEAAKSRTNAGNKTRNRLVCMDSSRANVCRWKKYSARSRALMQMNQYTTEASRKDSDNCDIVNNPYFHREYGDWNLAVTETHLTKALIVYKLNINSRLENIGDSLGAD